MFTALATSLHLGGDDRPSLVWTGGALALYGAVLAITFRIHIPLNRGIEAAGEPAGIADLRALRTGVEARWVRWNVARAVFSIAAFGCLTWALVLFGGR